MAEGVAGGAKVEAYAKRLPGGSQFAIEGSGADRVVWMLLPGLTQRVRLELVMALDAGYLTFKQLNQQSKE